MKKIFVLFALLFFVNGFSPVDVVPAFKNLKGDIVFQLNDIFDREVAVESISGTLINQIELNNVSIAKEKKLSDGTIIKAKKIILNYNPFKLAASRGNISAALSKITVIEPEILVERSINDEWNMAGLIPQTKPLEEKEKPRQMIFSGNVVIRGGHGFYVDHMGFGEDLKGRPFTSKIRDFNGEVRVSGFKVDIAASATSVIDKSIAYTKVKGNVNIRTGKYRFVVNASNVDIEKWGYYTLNIPHFKPISGRSDMTLTMTNPPPRKKGLPIFFDGKFNIKGGKGIVFDRLIEGIDGFVWVHDEDARFKDLKGRRATVPLTVNGRLYDFNVANYDIDINAPGTSFDKLSAAFPEISAVDFSGGLSAKVHVGGDYGHPLFNGTLNADGFLFKQKIRGVLDFISDGPVLSVRSDNISSYGGKFAAACMFDLTSPIPNIDAHITGESIDLKHLFPALTIKDRSRVEAEIKGSAEKFTVSANGVFGENGSASVFGTKESDSIELIVSAEGINVSLNEFKGKLSTFNARISASLNVEAEKSFLMDGQASFNESSFASQPISDVNAGFRFQDNTLHLRPLVMRHGSSNVKITGQTGIGVKTDLHVEAASAEASDLKILEALLPNEVTPVSGKMDIDILVSGEVRDAAKIRPADFSVAGKIALRNGFISYEKLDSLDLHFAWTASRFALKDTRIRTRFSDVLLNGTFESGGNMDIDMTGKLDLANLKPMTLKYGRFFGTTKIKCRLSGKMDNPAIDADFDAKDVRYNEIFINGMNGRFIYDGKNIYTVKPISINQANDKYLLAGNYRTGKEPAVSLRLDVVSGDLNTAVALLEDINREIGTKQIFGPTVSKKNIILYPGRFQFPPKNTKSIYKSDDKKTTIDELSRAERESSAYGKTIKEKASRNLTGKFSGYLEVKGALNDLSGRLDFTVAAGTIESYQFDEARLKGGLENGTFEVSSVYIRKGNGLLVASGYFNPASSVSMEVVARDMPIDFLSLFLGTGKQFEGNFNMDGFLRGPVSSPNGSVSIKAGTVKIAGIDFDSVNSSVIFNNNTLDFKRTELLKGGNRAIVSGALPLDKEGVSLSITMEGDSIGLLSMASKDITWLRGSGAGYVKISGKLSHPKFNGYLRLNEAAFSFKPIESNLENINSNITITDNVMSTESLSAKWIGKWTQMQPNKIKLSGSIGWDRIFLNDKALDFDLKMKDSSYSVDFPNLYKGDLEVAGFSFKGPLWLAPGAEKAPKISGVFTLSNGVIMLPDMTQKSKLTPIELDMVLNIQKNTSVVAGDINNLLSSDFSNLMLNLELEGQKISFSGNLQDPNIQGKTIFKFGTVNILNREFSLMSEERQKTIYATDLDKVKENSAVFSGGSLPRLTLAAEIRIKITEQLSEPGKPGEPKTIIYKTTNVLVASRINGIPFSKEKEEGLRLSFDSFIEDATKQPAELIPAGYDEQEIKVLLLPDFIKGPLGISNKGVTDVDANEVLVDYLNSRLNAYLLRNVERNLAKSLELESLTLEYNFGKDIKNMLPAKSTADLGPQEVPETMYGISAVKGFFDRFYLDVRYSQAVQEQNLVNRAFLNYQITYKLSPILSVVYYREPFSFIEEESDYYKVTLKAGYQL